MRAKTAVNSRDYVAIIPPISVNRPEKHDEIVVSDRQSAQTFVLMAQ